MNRALSQPSGDGEWGVIINGYGNSFRGDKNCSIFDYGISCETKQDPVEPSQIEKSLCFSVCEEKF